MIELDQQSFNSKIAQSKGIAVIDFWAPWCGPCRQFAPHFEEASKQAPEVLFAKVNVDEQGEIAGQFGVMSIPTVIFFKDGKPVNQFSGARPKDQILQIIKQIK